MYRPQGSLQATRQRNATLREAILRELQEAEGRALTPEQLEKRVRGLDRAEVYTHVNFLRTKGYRDQIESVPLEGRRASTQSMVAYRWAE